MKKIYFLSMVLMLAGCSHHEQSILVDRYQVKQFRPYGYQLCKDCLETTILEEESCEN